MKKLILFALTAAIFIGCSKDPVTVTDIPRTERKIFNLSYGTNARNVMDVYLPANRTNATPVCILIHGGGWNSGDKADMNGFIDSLFPKGVACVTMNYRYSNMAGVDCPQMMDDVQAVVQKMVDSSQAWGIKYDHYTMAGYSAGGHMALLYTHRYNVGNRVGAVISMVGPTNLNDDNLINYYFLLGQLPTIEDLVGAAWNFGNNRAPFQNASPIFGLRNIPTMMVYGQAAIVVPVDQGRQLNASLQAKGYTKEYTEFLGANHDLSLTTNAVYRDSLTRMVRRWITKYN